MLAHSMHTQSKCDLGRLECPVSGCCVSRSRKRQMEIKAALAQARKNEEAQFAKDWQDRLKQLKAEEVSSCTNAELMKQF